MPALALRRALMPQESAVAFDFTAQEIVALGRYPHRGAGRDEDAITEEAMALTDVSALAPRVLNTLSGGEKARAHMARALAQLWHPRPDGASRWLLLDEPTAALDLAHQHAAMRLLRAWAAARRGRGGGAARPEPGAALCRRGGGAGRRLGWSDSGAGSRGAGAGADRAVWRTPCQPVTSADGTVQYLFG
jgi:iron complex transport system ATP-binding protein